MIAIFAFTIIPDHYKPLNDDFIRLAKLSVKSAKKYYKTKFYCDRKSLAFFAEHGIFFDEVVIINGFVNDYPTVYSISKIYAMMNETEPYILLDFDTVLLEKLESTHTITYGQPETDFNVPHISADSISFVYDFYVKPFNDHIKKYYSQEELSNFNWLLYPCFCLVMVKNPIILKDIFNKLFDLIDKEDIGRITPSLLEQFLSHQYIIKNKVDFGFITHDQYYNPGDFNALQLISKKYVHLHINNKIITDEIAYLEEIIK